MLNQIYIIYEKSRSNFKIGSTCNFANRIGGYITPCDYFDNSTHLIILYTIQSNPDHNSNPNPNPNSNPNPNPNPNQYTCYQLDWVIQQLSTKYSYPFVKLVDNSGGNEFYKLNEFDRLDEFFNKLNQYLKLKC